MIQSSSGIIIKDGKPLLVKKEKGNDYVWIFPGGSIEQNETSKESLIRELEEELPGTKLKNISYLDIFEDEAHYEKDSLISHVYIVDILGNTGEPSREISDKAFYEFRNPKKISKMGKQIINYLVKQNLIGINVQLFTENKGKDYCFKVDHDRTRICCSRMTDPLEYLAFMFKPFYEDYKKEIIFENSPEKYRKKFTKKERSLFMKYINN